MAVTISGTAGINMGNAPIVSVSQLDSTVINENGVTVATTTDVGTANSDLVKTALNATGSAPIYACRAWVNFNGTGTVAIRASGNVSSITDMGVGVYVVNFTTAMPDANYVANGSAVGSTLDVSVGTLDVNSVRALPRYSPDAANNSRDSTEVLVSIFR